MSIPSGKDTTHVAVIPRGGATSSSPKDPTQNVKSSTDTSKQTAPATPKKLSRVKRSEPWVLAGRPIKPGPRRFLWWFYAWFRLYKIKWIPQPRSVGLYTLRVLELVKSTGDLRKVSMAIIAVLTTKGGATKTTVATWLAAVLMWIIKLQVFIFDADVGGGKVNKRFLLDRTTAITGVEIVDKMTNDDENGKKWSPTYRDLIEHANIDPETGVMVSHATPKSVISAENIGIALTGLATGNHTVIADTGPGLAVSVTTGLAHKCTVGLVVGDANSSDDLDDITETLDFEEYGLRDPEKIKNIVIVISGVKWRKFNTRTQYRYAARYEVEPEQIVLIPFNRYLKNEDDNQDKPVKRPVRVSALNPKTLYAWCVLAHTVSERAAAYNAAHPSLPLPGGAFKENPKTASPTEDSVASTISTAPPRPAHDPSAGVPSEPKGVSL